MSDILVKSIRHGVIRVRAFGCGVPGLLVSPAIDTAGWMITHARSGLGVAWFPEADPEAVLAAAQALAGSCDWTASAQGILRTAPITDIKELCLRWGGRFYSHASIPDRFGDLPAVTQ